METQRHEHMNVGRIDELTIGTPGKGGSVTVKVNWAEPEEANKLIGNAIIEREKASKKYQESLLRESEEFNKKRE